MARGAAHPAEALRAALDGRPVLFQLASRRLSDWAARQALREEVCECDPSAVKYLGDVIPDILLWRAEIDDVLAHLPDGLTQESPVAQIKLTAKSITMQEDFCGAICANYLASSSSSGDGVECLVVPAESKHLAVQEWGLLDGAHWPTEAQLHKGGFEVERFIQQPGELLLLPPCTLCLRRMGPSDGVLLQWLRVPPSCMLAAFSMSKLRTVPTMQGTSGWRSRQLQPPVQLACFLMLSERLEKVANKLGDTSMNGGDREREELQALYKVGCALLSAERMPTAWRVQLLGDNTARACDCCAREIFNRCVRLRRPLVLEAFEPAHGTSLYPALNPYRSEQRQVDEDGDFCLACVANGHVRTGQSGGAKLMEQTSHSELLTLLSLTEQALRQINGAIIESCGESDGGVESLGVQAVRQLQRGGLLTELVLPEAAQKREVDAARPGAQGTHSTSNGVSLTHPQHTLSRMRGGTASCDGDEDGTQDETSSARSLRGFPLRAMEDSANIQSGRSQVENTQMHASDWDDEPIDNKRRTEIDEEYVAKRLRHAEDGAVSDMNRSIMHGQQYNQGSGLCGANGYCAMNGCMPMCGGEPNAGVGDNGLQMCCGPCGLACNNSSYGLCGCGPACGVVPSCSHGQCCPQGACCGHGMGCGPGPCCGGMGGCCGAMPGAVMPGGGMPGGGMLGGGMPGGGIGGMPGIGMPGIGMPGVGMPGAAMPGAAMPGAAMLGGAMPGGCCCHGFGALGGSCCPIPSRPQVACGGMGTCTDGEHDGVSCESNHDVAMAGLQEVLHSNEFQSFIEFCRAQGKFESPADEPNMALKFIESNVQKKLTELNDARLYCMTEQKNALADVVSRRSELGADELHNSVNRILAQTLTNVRTVNGEMESHRSRWTAQRRLLQEMHHNMQRQVQQQQQHMNRLMMGMHPAPMMRGAWMPQTGSPCDWGSPLMMPQSEPSWGMGLPNKMEHEMGGDLVIEIPNDSGVNFLIGAKGKSINELQDRTGTKIQIQRDPAQNLPFRQVTITGGTENDRARAQEMIFAKIREFHERDLHDQRTSCAEPGRGDDGRSRDVRSSRQVSMSTAQHHEQSEGAHSPAAAQSASEEVSMMMSVPPEKGEKINQIQSESCCRVHIDKDDIVENGSSVRMVRISGRSPADCERAKKLVHQACEAAATREVPQAFNHSVQHPSSGHPSQYRSGQLSGDRASECVLSGEEVEALVAKREDCRRRKDFAAADGLRQQCWEKGIELLDKERQWKTVDGRWGQYAPLPSETGRNGGSFDGRRENHGGGGRDGQRSFHDRGGSREGYGGHHQRGGPRDSCDNYQNRSGSRDGFGGYGRDGHPQHDNFAGYGHDGPPSYGGYGGGGASYGGYGHAQNYGNYGNYAHGAPVGRSYRDGGGFRNGPPMGGAYHEEGGHRSGGGFRHESCSGGGDKGGYGGYSYGGYGGCGGDGGYGGYGGDDGGYSGDGGYCMGQGMGANYGNGSAGRNESRGGLIPPRDYDDGHMHSRR